MSFTIATLYRRENPGERAAYTCYSYSTGDDIEAIMTPGYFAGLAPRYTLKLGDYIEAATSEGFYKFQVVSPGDRVAIAYQPVRDEVLIKAESGLAAQEPTGLDTPLVLDFGGPVGIDSDPIQLLANQRFRANVDLPDLRARVRMQVGRLSVPMTANMFIRTLVDGVQPASSLFIQMDDNVQSYPVYITAWFGLSAGQEIWFEMIRDSGGNDSGGLYSTNPVTAGWNEATTTFIQISSARL